MFQLAGADPLLSAAAPSSCERCTTTAAASTAPSKAMPPRTSRRCARTSITAGSVANRVVGASRCVGQGRPSPATPPQRPPGDPPDPCGQSSEQSVAALQRIRHECVHFSMPRAASDRDFRRSRGRARSTSRRRRPPKGTHVAESRQVGSSSKRMPSSASWAAPTTAGAPVSGSDPLDTFGNAVTSRMFGSPASNAMNRSSPSANPP